MTSAHACRAVLVTAVALLVMLAGHTASASAAVRKPSAAKDLRTLVGQTARLPGSSVTPGRQARLLRLARHARRVAATSPCSSVADLRRFRRTLRTTRLRRSVRRSQRARRLAQLAGLNGASTAASRSLLASKRTKRCGGGVAPSTLSETKTAVLRSDESGMTLRVALPQLQFVPESAGDRTFTRLAAPDTQSPGAPGSPGIPVASEIFGVPDGAKLEVTTSNAKTQTIDGVEVYPVQPEPVDQSPGQTPAPNIFAPPFTKPPFTLDRRAYASKGYTDGARGKALGQVRDLNVGGLQIPLAQYDPVRDRLKVFTSVDVKVEFVGGTRTMSDNLGSPWETAQHRFAGGLLNGAVVRKVDREIVFQPCGEELLVITNPATLSAADTYATARRAAGLLTSVRQTGDAAGQVGTTSAQIRAFIRSQLNHGSCIRPSYVTFIGDDKLVPTFTNGPSGIPSDNPYSTKDDADELPDVAVGRILGNDLAQIDAQLAKIIRYETTPPTGPMLNRALIAAQFQDTDGAGQVSDGQENRTFIQFAERARDGLVKRGVAVDRVYNDVPASNPQRFVDGTNLPASLRKPAFAWNGDGADISAAWNEGRFMVVHRDHGWSDGWVDPAFETSDVDALTNDNDNLPVVLSINCSSARYDTDDTSFVQNALVKPTGGAVGAFGDTRDSPSWHNSEIALGFLDALLPSVLPGEGPATSQRVGDALVHGKLRLAGLAPPSTPTAAGDYDTRKELYLWHYFGDPTMQMWGGGTPPLTFNPNIFKAAYREFAPPRPGDPPPFLVEVIAPPGLAGQPFSLLRDGQVIGKALAGANGSAVVPALFNGGPPRPGELTVALEAQGAAPVRFGVEGVPAPPPPPPPAPTLTQNCPSTVAFNTQGTTTITVDGTLGNAPAGSIVKVTFTAPPNSGPNGTAGRVVVVDAPADASGRWSASVTTTNRAELGTWTAASRFANADGTATAGPCSIVVRI